MASHAPEPRPRPSSDARVEVGHTQAAQLRIPSPPVLPLSPDIHAQSATDPGVEVVQHDRRLAEAEVASPADQVSRQGRDQLRHTDTERPTRQFPDPLLELLQGLRGNLPGGLGVVRDRESQELSLPTSSHRALRFVDLELKSGRQEATDACHDALPRPAAAHVDVASSSPGEFHPQALTEPDGSLSAHPALITRPGPRLPAKFLPIAGLTRRRNGDSDCVSPPGSSPSLG